LDLERFDAAAAARALALVAPRADDLAEIYLEDVAWIELPPADENVGFRQRREHGLAARLVRGERAWSASRDELSGAALTGALRSVARSLPPTLPEPAGEPVGSVPPPPVDDVLAFPGRLERALRRRLVAFPLRLAVRWHERRVRVVGTRTATPVEHERFGSLEAATPWGSCGILVGALDDAAAELLAERLARRFRSRDAPPPPPGHPPLLLESTAAAVMLHESVAHALESDLLAASGHPGAAEGVRLGTGDLDVLDDPASAPAGAARSVDDEGVPVLRRWLLRGGAVAQPIADQRAARRWPTLLPGNGFRADRHAPPLPRTHHLELLAGGASIERLHELAEGGLAIAEIDAGGLDPVSGRLWLEVPGARRIRGGAPAEPVGRFRLRGRVGELLGGVVGIGSERRGAGAGWCAKGGQRKPVWATVPALVVVGLEVSP